jgi:uncharacterized membrane protein
MNTDIDTDWKVFGKKIDWKEKKSVFKISVKVFIGGSLIAIAAFAFVYHVQSILPAIGMVGRTRAKESA